MSTVTPRRQVRPDSPKRQGHSDRQIRVVLLGPPETNTHAKRIAKELGVGHLSMGEVLSSHVRAETSLGRSVKSYVEAGKLVPDALATKVAQGRLKQAAYRKGFLLEGYPRTANQAISLRDFLLEKGCQLDLVLLLTTDESKRTPNASDTESSLRQRDIYYQQTIPAVNECFQAAVVKSVQALRDKGNESDEVVAALRSHLRMGDKR